MIDLLHYVWQHKLFASQSLITTQQIPVEVINPGQHQNENEALFHLARVRIGAIEKIGSVKIAETSDEVSCLDNTIILCVVKVCTAPIYRSNGEELPQLVLRVPPRLANSAKKLLSTTHIPACGSYIPKQTKLEVHSWLTYLLIERLEEKVSRIEQLLQCKKYHWSDLFFITLARSFGFGRMGNLLEEWAKSLPYRALDKHKDALFQLEALFLGIGGLLDTSSDCAYLAKLQDEFHFLSTKFSLAVNEHTWVNKKPKPGQYPYVSLAQLAWFYSHQSALCDQVIHVNTLDECYELLSFKTSKYWEEHICFGKATIHRTKEQSKKAKDLLVINAIVPFIYAYGKHQANEELQRKALDLLTQVKPEYNYITRLWHQVHVTAENSADSQALIQLQKCYCDKKRCLACRFGYAYLRNAILSD